jgi:hypothetical protein
VGADGQCQACPRTPNIHILNIGRGRENLKKPELGRPYPCRRQSRSAGPTHPTRSWDGRGSMRQARQRGCSSPFCPRSGRTTGLATVGGFPRPRPRPFRRLRWSTRSRRASTVCSSDRARGGRGAAARRHPHVGADPPARPGAAYQVMERWPISASSHPRSIPSRLIALCTRSCWPRWPGRCRRRWSRLRGSGDDQPFGPRNALERRPQDHQDHGGDSGRDEQRAPAAEPSREKNEHRLQYLWSGLRRPHWPAGRAPGRRRCSGPGATERARTWHPEAHRILRPDRSGR